MIQNLETDKPAAEQTEEEILKEIRETYSYYSDYWREPREERGIDLRYICGDPWDPKDRLARSQPGSERPCISHDELTQYVNSCVNGARQNKRGIKAEPRGGQASDATAELSQSLIRAIEYDCQAPQIYLSAYQQMVEGSYAFFRIGRKWANEDPDAEDESIFDQDIVVRPIPNPNSVLYDPHCKEPDWSDAQRVIVLDPMPREEFKRRWPDARITDFTSDDMKMAPDWIQAKLVLVAEFWRIEKQKIGKRYLWEDGTMGTSPRRGEKPVNVREMERIKVVQRLTNGVEILKTAIPSKRAKHIPIIPMMGLERWTDTDGGPRRKLFSLIRLARDPQMSLAYLVSQQMEEAGMTPKVPFIGWKGQFDSAQEAWQSLTKVPVAYIEADVPEEMAERGLLPSLPTRVPFTPNFAAYEVAKDSCRRAIQAAVGINPLPTAAQRDSQKSGIAIERMNKQQEIGSFHFIDSYERAIAYGGRVIEEQIAEIYDRPNRRMGIRKNDDSHMMVHANTEGPYMDPQTQQMAEYQVLEDAQHSITLSSGPSYESQREEAGEFLDLLVTNMQSIPPPGTPQAKLLSLAIQMKQLGPKGDEMAEIIAPNDAGAAQQQMQQLGMLQIKTQQQEQLIVKLQQDLNELELKEKGKVIDNEYKMALEKMRLEVDVAKSEIATKSQMLSERLEFVNDVWSKLQDHAHERGMQAGDQAHAAQQAEAAAQQQQAMQNQQQAQDGADSSAPQG